MLKKLALKNFFPVLLLVLVFFSFLQSSVYGQNKANAADPRAGVEVETTQDVLNILNNIVSFMVNIFWVVSVAFIIATAFMYLTARGDAEKVGKAHMMLVWTMVSIALVLVSNGVRFFVKSFVDTT